MDKERDMSTATLRYVSTTSYVNRYTIMLRKENHLDYVIRSDKKHVYPTWVLY